MLGPLVGAALAVTWRMHAGMATTSLNGNVDGADYAVSGATLRSSFSGDWPNDCQEVCEKDTQCYGFVVVKVFFPPSQTCYYRGGAGETPSRLEARLVPCEDCTLYVVQERWNDGTLQVLLWTLLGASVAYTLFVLSTRASARAAPAGVDRPEAPLQDPRIEEAEAPPDPRIDEAAAKLSPERRKALEHLCERFPDVEPAQAADAIRMAQKYVTGGHNIESAAAATLAMV